MAFVTNIAGMSANILLNFALIPFVGVLGAALATAISNVYKLCDKAVSKGILHKNTAARKKSRLVFAIKLMYHIVTWK